jgi:putative endonuclease
MYYVYFLASEETKWIYIGYTEDLERRLIEHNSGKSEYTSHRGPWKLVYYEAFLNQDDAKEREKSLKHHAKGIGLLKNRISRSLKGEGRSRTNRQV